MFEASSEIQLLHKIFEVVGLPRECEWPRDSTIPWKSWSNLPQQPIRPLSCLLPGISPLALDFLQVSNLSIVKQNTTCHIRQLSFTT